MELDLGLSSANPLGPAQLASLGGGRSPSGDHQVSSFHLEETRERRASVQGEDSSRQEDHQDEQQRRGPVDARDG